MLVYQRVHLFTIVWYWVVSKVSKPLRANSESCRRMLALHARDTSWAKHAHRNVSTLGLLVWSLGAGVKNTQKTPKPSPWRFWGLYDDHNSWSGNHVLDQPVSWNERRKGVWTLLKCFENCPRRPTIQNDPDVSLVNISTGNRRHFEDVWRSSSPWRC